MMNTKTLVLLLAVVMTLVYQSTNLGPNSSVFSPAPLNPTVQSIHPR